MTDDRNPSAAPGELDLVRRFVNTLDIESGADAFASPSEAAAWLRLEGWRVRVVGTQLPELVGLREALRDLVGSRGTPGEIDAMASVDAIAHRHPLTVRLSSPDTLVPTSTPGADAFIERVLGLVAKARIDGSWDRVKTCANDGCRWLFFDHSRNRSRTWCAMDRCGSQAKMRAYRNRRRSTSPTSTSTRG
jgi:predicted RNA-binding Zn ribbon-like protein